MAQYLPSTRKTLGSTRGTTEEPGHVSLSRSNGILGTSST